MADKTALTNVRVFDGVDLTGPTTVVVDGPVIGTDARGVEILDGGGGTLLPGLFDAHVHMNAPGEPAELLDHGITTALDMACFPAEKMRSFRGMAPDIRSAGTPAIGPGGPHSHMPGMPREAVLDGPEGAEEFVARRVADGVDYIKIVVDGDRLGQATVDALVAAGQRSGKLTVAHAASLASFRRAVRSGVDVVTHVPRDGVLDQETVAQMVEQGQVAVPTLAMMKAVIKGAGTEGEDYSCSRESVAALHRAGVPVLAGTDAFAGPAPVPDPVPHGTGLHHELALLVDAGLTAAEALRAATVLPARHFRLRDRGALTAGLRADLLLIDGDPLTDITATRNIRRVWCAGAEHARAH